MDKSFCSWRPQSEGSESDSDCVKDSQSESSVLYPDSDSYRSFSNYEQEGQVIPPSDDDDDISPPVESSPAEIAPSSDSEDSIVLNTRKGQKFVLESDEDENSSYSNAENTQHDKDVCSRNSNSFFHSEDIYSSTFVEDALHSENSSNNYVPQQHLQNSRTSRKKSSLSATETSKSSIIDLTILDSGTRKPIPKIEFRNIIESDESDAEEKVNDNIIIVESDSGEDEPKHKKNDKVDKTKSYPTNQLSLMKISGSSSTSQPLKPPVGGSFDPNLNKVDLTCNDYSTRVESLKAEESRLKMLVANVLKNIETTKTTLKTANLSALPDRGVRLQKYCKEQESKLRELRYQQSTIANAILEMQFTSNGASQRQLQPVSKPVERKLFNLATANTDLNAMGKRAMETHRVQQSVTLDALRALHNSLKNCPQEDTLADDPKSLRIELMPHQKHALAWLLWREKEKPSGGILADDMGLGKTLTMISLILKTDEEKGDESSGSSDSDDSEEDSKENSNWLSKAGAKLVPGKTLVVCPATLLGQWEGEITNRVKRGALSSVVHHGQNRETRARRLAGFDVVITTYNILSLDAQKQQSPLFQIRWERVILDEAHQIRNYKTKTAQAVFKIKAKSRWALTGTPVHNKELDMYALVNFLKCKPFDDLSVWKKWVDNRDAAGLQRLTTITKTVMLRRTKKGLQEKGELNSLPEKKFHTINITLDKEEKEAYEKLLLFSKTLFAQFLHQNAEKQDALKGIPVTCKTSATRYLQNQENPFDKYPELARLHQKMKEIRDVKGHDILVIILRLRQFCCHPGLIKSMLDKEDITGGGIEDSDGLDVDLMDKFTRMSVGAVAPESGYAETDDTDKCTTSLSSDSPLFASDRISSKMRMVMETLEEILGSDDKVVVVSQWVSLLDIVYKILKNRHIKCSCINGSVPVSERPAIVEKFNRENHGPKVMLLSLTAGGVGLNLVGGNHLLLLDLHWNPQLENQACDRIYRVGQRKSVNIYKFVSSETIEERILLIQQNKLAVAENILSGAGVKHSSKLTLDDLKNLFQMT